MTEAEQSLRELIYGGHPDGVFWLGDEPQNDIVDVILRAGWRPASAGEGI